MIQKKTTNLGWQHFVLTHQLPVLALLWAVAVCAVESGSDSSALAWLLFAPLVAAGYYGRKYLEYRKRVRGIIGQLGLHLLHPTHEFITWQRVKNVDLVTLEGEAWLAFEVYDMDKRVLVYYADIPSDLKLQYIQSLVADSREESRYVFPYQISDN